MTAYTTYYMKDPKTGLYYGQNRTFTEAFETAKSFNDEADLVAEMIKAADDAVQDITSEIVKTITIRIY